MSGGTWQSVLIPSPIVRQRAEELLGYLREETQSALISRKESMRRGVRFNPSVTNSTPFG